MSNISRGADNVNNTTLELQQDLARCTPRQCLTLTHSVPSVQMYYALRTKLESCNEKWLQEFLDLGGLDSLLDSLDQMAGRGFTCFSDAILQIDCISCVRCILNTGIGLEYFVSNDVYTKKLTMALNSGDTLPKKQVFEVLSAVCVYSNIGYLRVLEGLSYVKTECDQMHRFSLVVNDLQASETIAHKTSVLTFINAIINSTPDITERIRIRNEFIGLNLLDILTYIRKEEPDEDLLLQLEVFHERKISDEDLLNTNNNLDFNSPQDLLDQLQSRIFGTPRMVNFVNILQDFLAIETVHNENSVKLWQTVDNLIHHVVHTMSSPNLTSIQSVLHKLPEEIQQGLQCIQSYQNRKSSASLTSLHSNTSQSSKHGSKTSLNSKRDSKSSLKSKRDSQSSLSSKRGSRGSVSSLNKPNIAKSVTFQDETSNQSGSANYSNSGNQSASANYSANSDSSPDSHNGVQNETIVLNKLGESSQSQNSAYSSGVNDKTVVLCQNLSNTKNDSLRSSVSSHQSSEDSLDSYSLNKTDSFKVKSKKTGDQSCERNQSNLSASDMPNVSEQIAEDGRNMNIKEEKLLNYNQSKVGSQLRVPSGRRDEQSRKEKCGSVYDNIPEPDMEPVSNKTTGMTKMQSLSKLKRTISKMSSPKNDAPHVVVKPCNMVARPSVPAPNKQVVDLKWVVLTDDRIVGHEPCVWLPTLSDKEKLSVDYKKLEIAFQTAKSEMVEEVALLNANTRLNINLFLSRLDSGAEDLVQNLEEGNLSQLSLPMLQYLIKLMPCPEEVEMLRSYTGPRLELGMAEQFVLLLSDIPDYSVLLEGQLIRAEFDLTMSQFKDSLNAMIATANLVLNHPDLKRLLHVILGIGNFLNNGMFNGDAAGFKISTLMRLPEVKSRSPCKSLLHHLVQMVNEGDQKLLGFVNEILPLEKAASCSVEELKGNISKLNGKLRNFVNNLTKSGQQLQNMFASFIEILKTEFATIQCATTELRSLTDQLAEYFCEEESQFNIQEFFQCLLSFCKEVKKCQSDNIAWARQQQLAKKKGDALHKRLKNKLFSLEFGENAAASSSMVEHKPKVLEKMLDQLHRGNFNPSMPSVLVAPDNEYGTQLEMSCIPCEDSPLYRPRVGTNLSDSVFIDTPELTRAEGPSAAPKLTRSSTQKINAVTTCTAQTKDPARPYNERLVGELPESYLGGYLPSPISATPADRGKMPAPQKKLFGVDSKNMDSKKENDLNLGYEKPKLRQQLELPRRHRGHCRSRSDLADSICAVNKWIEYEKTRNSDHSGKAPLAEPESACNISTLNLENQGKFITKEDVADYRHPSGIYQDEDVCNLQEGPVVKMPDGKQKKPDKKSSVGGFFSKLGRAVLKPRNVYSDGDQYGPGTKLKKPFNTDKENISLGAMTEEERGLRESKRFKPEGNKVSRFFQRGGIYRSSKMKAKNQHQNVK